MPPFGFSAVPSPKKKLQTSPNPAPADDLTDAAGGTLPTDSCPAGNTPGSASPVDGVPVLTLAAVFPHPRALSRRANPKAAHANVSPGADPPAS